MKPYAVLKTLLPETGQPIDWPAVCACVPELEPLGASLQDPVHHQEGDVLTHTRMVIDSLCALSFYQAASPERRFVMFYAALLHDIAKTSCAVKTGERISNPGHSRRGAIDARAMLWRAGVPFSLREDICRIILNHQVPFFAINGTRSGESCEYLVRKLSWELSCVAELAAVAEADIRGRICEDTRKTLDNIELFRELAREEGCYEGARGSADPYTRFLYAKSRGTIALDYPFYQEKGSSVIVLSGLPASGKNTWVSAHAKGLPVVSFDDAKEELGLTHRDNAGAAVQLALERARECLRKGAPFVWNATHLSTQMRDKTLSLLHDYHADVRIVYLECAPSELFSRNAKRDTTLTNQALEKMLFRWEVPLPTEAPHVDYLIQNN